MHLALLEVRLAAARFFLTVPNAVISKREGMCDKDMVPAWFFMMGPRGHRLLVEAENEV